MQLVNYVSNNNSKRRGYTIFIAIILVLVPILSVNIPHAHGSSSITDFNCDGYDDLAIGVPLKGIGSILVAGAVNVIYGSASGLKSAGNQAWHQDSSGIKDFAEIYDWFGNKLQ